MWSVKIETRAQTDQAVFKTVKTERMFGTFRFALALAVVLGHLWLPDYVGHYAVFAFYILSGYLITRVVNNVYGFTPGGLARFALNRALRIYPSYLAAMALSVAMIVLIGHTPAAYLNTALEVPQSATGWLENLTLLGLDSWSPARLVPPAWALAVELTFYALIAAGLGRSRTTSLTWACSSLVLTAYWIGGETPYVERYPTLLAGSLPFSIGSALHFIGPTRSPAYLSLALVSMSFLANLALAPRIGPLVASFYASLVLSALMICMLAPVRPAPRLRKIDDLLGGLSYPIYLLHWQAGTLAWLIFGAPRDSWLLFIATVPLLISLAVIVHLTIDIPMNSVRARIRSSSHNESATSMRHSFARTVAEGKNV